MSCLLIATHALTTPAERERVPHDRLRWPYGQPSIQPNSQTVRPWTEPASSCNHKALALVWRISSMHEQVVITTDALAALKPLLASAVQSELRMLELGLEHIAERLQAFEKQYGLTSEEFAHRFA